MFVKVFAKVRDAYGGHGEELIINTDQITKIYTNPGSDGTYLVCQSSEYVSIDENSYQKLLSCLGTIK